MARRRPRSMPTAARPRSRAWGAALLALCTLSPAVAAADRAACKRAYEDQRFEEAVKVCAEVARDPLAERRAVLGALEVTGMAELVLGRERPARAAFCQALALDSRYRPTDPIYPQRFVAAFDAVRGACPSAPRLVLDSAVTRAGAAVRVRLVGPPPPVARIGVYYREAGERRWRRELVPADAERVELPRLALADADAEVFAVLLIDEHYVVARAGTVDRPLHLRRLAQLSLPPPRREPSPVPFWRRGWFWWAVAGVAATTLVVSVSVAASGHGGLRGSLDTWQLPLRLPGR